MPLKRKSDVRQGRVAKGTRHGLRNSSTMPVYLFIIPNCDLIGDAFTQLQVKIISVWVSEEVIYNFLDVIIPFIRENMWSHSLEINLD